MQQTESPESRVEFNPFKAMNEDIAHIKQQQWFINSTKDEQKEFIESTKANYFFPDRITKVFNIVYALTRGDSYLAELNEKMREKFHYYSGDLGSINKTMEWYLIKLISDKLRSDGGLNATN